MTVTALLPDRIFDGSRWHEGAALRIRGGRVEAVAAPEAGDRVERLGGWLVPGFVDLQVNGGGGALLNNDCTPEGIARICAAHAAGGTTAILVTLITDRPEATPAAIAAVEAARAAGQPGLLGLHLEGPHLSVARKGTHDPALIRPMTDADLAVVAAAPGRVGHLVTTVAPESVSADQVRALAAAGVVVSLGHTDADAATARRHVEAGARMVTHLFNAMSQLGHRAPGVVGVALDDPRLASGLIADGFHVDPVSMGVALRAVRGRLFLVTDAMSTIGTDLPGFTLNGRQVYRRGGRLTLADGTLAGADIDMISSVRFVVERLGLPLDEALRMAALYPAEAVGATTRGALGPGTEADAVLLTPALEVAGTWIGGRRVA
jgi:N-acetylglucosamine-6-phosphate deacetylase